MLIVVPGRAIAQPRCELRPNWEFFGGRAAVGAMLWPGRTMYNPVTRQHYAFATSGTRCGRGAQFNTPTDYIEVAADADAVLDSSECTILVCRELLSTVFSTGVQHGYLASANDRAHVRVPWYADETITFDYGNGTSGSGRIVAGASGTWRAGVIETFAFVAGATRGRELWRNGVMIAQNTSATATRTATAKSFRWGAADGTGGAHNEVIYFAVTVRRALAPDALARWGHNPWAEISRSDDRVIFLPTSGSTAADLAGAATVSVLGAGVLSVSVSFSAAAVAGALGSGSMQSVQALGSAGVVAAAGAGALTMAMPISAAALAAAVGSGNLDSGGAADLSGAGLATAGGAASVSVSLNLSSEAVAGAIAQAASGMTMGLVGSAAAGAAGAGSMLMTVPLIGAATARGVGSGDLDVGAAADLAGAAASITLAGGTMTVSLRLDAAAVLRAIGQGTLSGGSPVAVFIAGSPRVFRDAPRPRVWH